MSMLVCITLLALAVLQALAFDNSRYDNVAVYWGQNSHGAANGADTADYQKTLSYYCQDNSIDAIPVAFITTFFSTGGLPSLNLANICNPTDNATFAGTALPNCAALASDIAFCQSKGKIVTISLGGAGGGVGLSSTAQAQSFAQTIWNLFLGGSSSTRPFGSAVLDGVDLDIENGANTYYADFVNEIRTLSAGKSKPYYVTAAPQCPYPDASLGAALNAASFDAVYVQFYNNQCGLQAYGSTSWDFGVWDVWARTVSPNRNVKVYLGAPASSTAAGTGYLPAAQLAADATAMRKVFPSFGGIMLWDASQAWANGRYDAAMKAALVAAGGTGFTYPACSAPAWVSGTGYPAGSQVTYNGYIWQSKWYADDAPAAVFTGDWNPISACGGAPVPPSSTQTTSTPTPTPTSKPGTTTTKSSSSSSSPGGGSCAGVAAWSSAIAYTGGTEATYGGYLWQAKWWTQADTPGGSAGVWTQLGACAAANAAAWTFNTAATASRVGAPAHATATEAARALGGSRFFRR